MLWIEAYLDVSIPGKLMKRFYFQFSFWYSEYLYLDSFVLLENKKFLVRFKKIEFLAFEIV